MPAQIRRRHPLFLRLLKPLSAYTTEPFIEMTMDDDDDPEGSEVGVYLATRPSRQLEQWARDIRRRHRQDLTHKTDEGVSALSLEPLTRASLRKVGRGKPEVIGELGVPVKTVRGEQLVFVSQTFMAIAVLRRTNEAVGFVSFATKWDINSHNDDLAELEVEPDQAWIDPAYRRKRRGELMAFVISRVVGHQIQELEDTTRWTPEFPTKLDICVLADIYSKSGEAFLEKCADAVATELNWWVDLKAIKIKGLSCRPYW